jgi:hypothetical protein
MFRSALAPALLLVAACGGDPQQDALSNAANQSDPAAADVLEGAAENGMDPQEALEQAGRAQVETNVQSTVQARPNLPRDPNRPPAGQPPEKIDVVDNVQEANAAENEHAGHNMQE